MNRVMDWIHCNKDLLFEIVLFSWTAYVVISVAVEIWIRHRKR